MQILPPHQPSVSERHKASILGESDTEKEDNIIQAKIRGKNIQKQRQKFPNIRPKDNNRNIQGKKLINKYSFQTIILKTIIFFNE